MDLTVPNDYNPVTLFHWLWWKLRCLEGSPEEFQQLFEKVASKVRQDFIKVRAYGKLGDRKCDGLYWGDGTVFQVYSPDELKQAETLKKIEVDLSGAVKEWGDQIKRWVFVYNTRVGLGPDVPRLLHEQRKKYPKITIDSLSSEQLWELMRGLSVQQRAEILGAPAGYEKIFLLPGTVSEKIEAQMRKGRFVTIQDVLSPINVRDAVDALKPEKPFGPPLHIRPSIEESWQVAAEYQTRIVEEALRNSRDLLPRFAVFSLAPIPLAIHLGYLLSDRVEVRPFQYDRDRKTWSWDSGRTAYDTEFQVAGLPTTAMKDRIDVILRVSLSASISAEDTVKAAGNASLQIDLSVDKPDVMWLCHPEQLTKLTKVFRELLSRINRLAPNCDRIHLFYAGPTGGAIVLGQTINPRMNAPIVLYEYDRRKKPTYERVLELV
jgi:hypothetical protein